ncbi:Polyprenol reductase [Plasmodiophora brassicae]|uniref:3-oxo-5-alpha-steroid 4-dehydrogenase C-terminal domain-containing protein n=1 Tax=Plasmodiophora brassicae TaxID=37360 RepID=A0A0G4ITC8_PLABS|nr:hypothetical protein PBRA_006518 [Plasmodiophora brassicae]SPQ94488.1 unnamed protein product [Plasmodiophora brassicae]
MHFLSLAGRAFFLGSAAVVLLARAIPSRIAEAAYRYGKTLGANEDTFSSWSVDVLVRKATVPKRYFTHFYVFATVWVASLIVLVTSARPNSWPLILQTQRRASECGAPLDAILCLVLMQIQAARRLIECLSWVSASRSAARMHVAHYLLGFLFYAFAPLTLIASNLHSLAGQSQRQAHWVPGLLDQVQPRHLAAIVIFLHASYNQNRCHAVLASLRGAGQSASYKLPRAPWFRVLACPHYFFEVEIYLAMTVIHLGCLEGMVNAACIAAFVLIELGVVAQDNKRWYEQHFPKETPKKWWCIIPFIF